MRQQQITPAHTTATLFSLYPVEMGGMEIDRIADAVNAAHAQVDLLASTGYCHTQSADDIWAYLDWENVCDGLGVALIAFPLTSPEELAIRTITDAYDNENERAAMAEYDRMMQVAG